ncbi:Ras subfamily protein [Acanthamoeba castellanii str. Neff]|uniref:Ras subfamily protein n=1 Tax=Acanthamoeba castellanii (strain ATCC 30010 / Neff) TaxID=1257118 RepID=L8GW16_ACACF|nr:Ras subfamily protein [Acanthamoeba castellanii str. Neff]ELR16798.1 Ras subfamily protein [Acanthamoeba castellanii str. Neff]
MKKQAAREQMPEAVDRLMFAVRGGPNCTLWSLLLNAGASATASDSTGATPFHLACANGNWPVIQFLLQGKHIDCGYGINRRDNQRQTPLHYAARHGDESVVTLLLAHGANALAMSDHGDASQVAREAGHARLADLLKRHYETECPLLCMPAEVLLCVMEKLEPYDLCCVAQTCCMLDQLSSADCIWRRFCDARWADTAGVPWKTRYMEWLRPRLRSFARAGKTALKIRYTDNFFTLDSHHSIIDFASKKITVEGQPTILQLWDTAGQERFHSMSKNYYRGAAGALVVYDITDLASFHRVKWWVDSMLDAVSDTLGAEPPVLMLVGAKCDLEKRRQVTAAEGQALALELGALWTETSSLTGSGVREAFESLAASVLLGELQPASYVHNGGCHIPDHELLCRLGDDAAAEGCAWSASSPALAPALRSLVSRDWTEGATNLA